MSPNVEGFRDFIETIFLSLIIIFLIYQFVGSMEVVSGPSMEPNFSSNQRILVDRISHKWKPYQRGEIVVLSPPGDETKHFIKRIVGVPGDIIKVFECGVFISNNNGKFKLNEPYISKDVCTTGGSNLLEGRSIKLTEGQYVVMGDNRMYSVDSRVFGPITSKNLIGRVVFRFWPLKKAGFIL